MSKIGRAPIQIPDGVTVTLKDALITVKGPKGELQWSLPEGVRYEEKDSVLMFSVDNIDEQNANAMWGLSRALVANMIEGVTKGFEKKLQIIGVGYRAELKRKNLELHLGFSHPVSVEAPEGITFAVDNDIITVSGFDKQLVGEVSASIRSHRKPEPYKGKGVRYIDEHVRRKVGKAAASSE